MNTTTKALAAAGAFVMVLLAIVGVSALLQPIAVSTEQSKVFNSWPTTDASAEEASARETLGKHLADQMVADTPSACTYVQAMTPRQQFDRTVDVLSPKVGLESAEQAGVATAKRLDEIC